MAEEKCGSSDYSNETDEKQTHFRAAQILNGSIWTHLSFSCLYALNTPSPPNKHPSPPSYWLMPIYHRKFTEKWFWVSLLRSKYWPWASYLNSAGSVSSPSKTDNRTYSQGWCKHIRKYSIISIVPSTWNTLKKCQHVKLCYCSRYVSIPLRLRSWAAWSELM